MVNYKNKSLRYYLDDLSRKLPTPGGGSACALVAGVGVSLLSMVINFTLGKVEYIRYEKELRENLLKTESLRKKFLELVDEDVKAYRSKDVWYSLEVPLKIAYLCFSAIKLCPTLLKKGNVNLISDIASAVIFLEAGFSGAYFNVEANLRLIKDRKVKTKIRQEILGEARIIKNIREKVERKIGEIIRR
ncbi:MAG: cyclodeaminase/cyclohydrolase family protein [Candidatus Omnitrophica bacterium]|nr:cyclodeaminase/cyclohydrolase family protein [Candidatus Omnitrophota bacterium]